MKYETSGGNVFPEFILEKNDVKLHLRFKLVLSSTLVL